MRYFWRGARGIVMEFQALKDGNNQRVLDAIEEQKRLLADPLRASRRIMLASADENGRVRWIEVYRDGRWYHGSVARQSDNGDQLIINYTNGETLQQLLCSEEFTGDEVPPFAGEGGPLPWRSAGPIVNWKQLRLPSDVALNKAKSEPRSDLLKPPTDSHHMSDVGDGSNDDIPSVEGTETGSVIEEGAPPAPRMGGWRKPFQWS